jgi:hypothetical protein
VTDDGYRNKYYKTSYLAVRFYASKAELKVTSFQSSVPKEQQMTKFIVTAILLLCGIASVYGQDAVLARGTPALTQSAVERLESVYARLLDMKLDPAQRERFRQGLIKYWTENNRDGIKTSLDNLKYFDSPKEIAELKASSQAVVVESLRRDAAETGDPVSGVLVEAYDIAHPGMRAATRAHTFADLVGTWKRQDALGARLDPNNGSAVGVSYTDSGTLEITSQGSFNLVKVHNHCGGGCCRLDGSEESGTVTLVSGQLAFQTSKGSKLTDDACMGAKQRSDIKPSRSTVGWTIRPNINTGVTSLCLNTVGGKSECYEKQ